MPDFGQPKSRHHLATPLAGGKPVSIGGWGGANVSLLIAFHPGSRTHFVSLCSLCFSSATFMPRPNLFHIIQQWQTHLCCARLNKVTKRIQRFCSNVRIREKLNQNNETPFNRVAHLRTEKKSSQNYGKSLGRKANHVQFKVLICT